MLWVWTFAGMAYSWSMKTVVRLMSAVVAVALAFVLVPISPAEGEDCNTACGNKRASCDSTCNNTKTRCVVECGLPVLPGYEKCRTTCDDNQRSCSLQCSANEKICQVQCKVGG